MGRRALLKSLGVFCGSALSPAGLAAMAPTAVSPLSRFKLGAISDGFSQNFDEALEIMRGYGLSWVEIRNVFGVYNTEASPAQVQHRRVKILIMCFRTADLRRCNVNDRSSLGLGFWRTSAGSSIRNCCCRSSILLPRIESLEHICQIGCG